MEKHIILKKKRLYGRYGLFNAFILKSFCISALIGIILTFIGLFSIKNCIGFVFVVVMVCLLKRFFQIGGVLIPSFDGFSDKSKVITIEKQGDRYLLTITNEEGSYEEIIDDYEYLEFDKKVSAYHYREFNEHDDAIILYCKSDNLWYKISSAGDIVFLGERINDVAFCNDTIQNKSVFLIKKAGIKEYKNVSCITSKNIYYSKPYGNKKTHLKSDNYKFLILDGGNYFQVFEIVENIKSFAVVHEVFEHISFIINRVNEEIVIGVYDEDLGKYKSLSLDYKKYIKKEFSLSLYFLNNRDSDFNEYLKPEIIVVLKKFNQNTKKMEIIKKEHDVIFHSNGTIEFYDGSRYDIMERF